MAATVLVVEDEVKIRELLRSYLEAAGFEVLSTGSGAEAIGLARTAKPDLMVLDLRLPDVSGESVASEVRSASAVPILILTAKSSEHERILGLELGADDYVTKPFSPREVVLRAQAILRRGAPGAEVDGPRSFGGGEVVLDEERHAAKVRGETVDLTADRVGHPRGLEPGAGPDVLAL